MLWKLNQANVTNAGEPENATAKSKVVFDLFTLEFMLALHKTRSDAKRSRSSSHTDAV